MTHLKRQKITSLR